MQPYFNDRQSCLLILLLIVIQIVILVPLYCTHYTHHGYKTEEFDGISIDSNANNCYYIFGNQVLTCYNVSILNTDEPSICAVTVDSISGNCKNYTQYVEHTSVLNARLGLMVLMCTAIVPLVAFSYTVLIDLLLAMRYKPQVAINQFEEVGTTQIHTI